MSKRPSGWGATALSFKKAKVVDHAGSAYVEPSIKSAALNSAAPEPAESSARTNFSAWSETELKAFMDQRGEDYDDCENFVSLVQRASECEHNTGPAKKPDLGAADDEVDPLEAFMSDIGKTIEEQAESHAASGRPERALACDEDDAMADYLDAHAAKQGTGDQQEQAGMRRDEGYGSDEEVYETARALESDELEADQAAQAKQNVEPLPPIDHSAVSYAALKKNFYDENPEVFAMDDSEVDAQRSSLQIHVSGADVPRPVSTFEHCGFDASLMAVISKAGYTQPTPVQMQALPAALSGRDVLGIAKTGSGKTAAFVLPMVVHISQQARVRQGEGPIGVVLAPTRELAEQIHQDARRFSKPYGLRCCAAFGGLAKYPQTKELQNGAEIAVATPGRLIDLVQSGACDFRRGSFLVIDEADRCFDLGFEPQVFSIVRQFRPDRQTLLFSATMPYKVKRLVSEAMHDHVTVTVGTPGSANSDVKQTVLVMSNDSQKRQWLTANLSKLVDAGEVLVFANQKASVDALVAFVKGLGVKAEGMHGDLDQHSRMAILARFKAGTTHALVATDVAARGLDIRSIKHVVNYDAARDIDTHTHRIGRTGRAGDTDGAAITLLTPRESRLAAALVANLEAAGQEVPKNLVDVALKDAAYKKERKGPGGAPGRAVGGRGLGFGPPLASATQNTFSNHTNVYPPTSHFHPENSTSSPLRDASRWDGRSGMPPPPSRFTGPSSTGTGATAYVAAASADTARVAAASATPSDPVAAAMAMARKAAARAGAGGSGRGGTMGGTMSGSGSSGISVAAAAAAAPRGFTASAHRVGGDQGGIQVMMPVATDAAAAKREAPAAWMQKRVLQQRLQGSSGGGSSAFGQRPAATAAPASSGFGASFSPSSYGASGSSYSAAPGSPAPGSSYNAAGSGPSSYGAAPGSPAPAASSAYATSGAGYASAGAAYGGRSAPVDPVEAAMATAREAAAKLRGSGGGDSGYPPPPSDHGAAAYAPPPYQHAGSHPSQAGGGAAMTADDARRIGQAAAARIAAQASGGGAAAAAQYGQGAPAAAGAARAPMSAEEARQIAQAAAARIVAQSGSSVASGQTQDGQHWAWSKS